MARTSDPVGTAVASIGAGSSSGAAVVSVALFVLRTSQGVGGDTPAPGRGAVLVLASVMVALAIAVATGWRLSRPIGDAWRQSVIGALCVFGTSLLALVCLPVDLALGRAGLILYGLALLAGSTVAARAARRAGQR